MPSSRYAAEEFFSHDSESFAWMKRLPEEEMWGHVRRLDPIPRFKTKPRLSQLVCTYIGACVPRFQFFLDMGAGKTKLCLDLIQHAIDRGDVRHALVGVPRIINIGEWGEQIELHSDLTYSLVVGETMNEKWEKLFQGEVAVVDYHNLQLLLSDRTKDKGMRRNDSRISKVRRHFQFIGLDEIHKVGSNASKRWRILRTLTSTAEYCFGFSGTPFGRSPEVLWSEFLLVDRGETLGVTKGLFQEYFFQEEIGYWGKEWKFDRSKTRALYRRLQHRSIRYEESELVDLPERVSVPIHLDFNEEQRRHYLNAIEGLIAADGGERRVAPFVRMRQIASGYVEWTDDEGRHFVPLAHNPKLEALLSILDNVGKDEKMVVFCEYTTTGRIISEALSKEKIGHVRLYGGTKKPIDAVRQFKSDPKCRVLVANSESGGTGINLQSVCRYAVFFESPASPITRWQAIKRIHRPGQEHRCFIYDLIIKRSIDLNVLSLIEEGKELTAAVIDGRELKKLLMA